MASGQVTASHKQAGHTWQHQPVLNQRQNNPCQTEPAHKWLLATVRQCQIDGSFTPESRHQPIKTKFLPMERIRALNKIFSQALIRWQAFCYCGQNVGIISI